MKKRMICCLTLFAVLGCFPALAAQWSHITPGSEEEAGLHRSLNLQPPENPVVSVDELKQRAEAAGGLEEHPNADAITLISWDRTAFDAEGYYHLLQQEAVKILTERGVKQNGTVELGYGIPYDRVRVLDALIISPQGDVTKIRPEEIKDVADSSGANANIYEPIWRKKVILFPGAAPGSIVYVRFENCAVRVRTPGTLNWGHTFRDVDPIVSASCCLIGPSDKPLHWYVTNDPEHNVKFTKTVSGDHTQYCWTGGNLPEIKPETGMIPVQELKTSLLISTATWKEYSKTESKFVEPNLVPDDAIRAKVAELTAGMGDPAEKQRALFQYVTRKVRYMGVAFGKRPGINPDPVTRTFANNAGVCKDKAGLLTAMLRVAGIEAYYTLNNPTMHIFPQVALDQFNHAIVASRLPGEKQFTYLDVTADLVRSMCPADSGGTGVLRIMPEGADIDVIPVKTAEENMGYLTARDIISGSGDMTASVECYGEGNWDSMFRGALYYVNPGQHNELFGNIIQRISSGATLIKSEFTPHPVDDLSEPVRLSVQYSAPDFLVRTGKYALFKTPGTAAAFNWMYQHALDMASVPRRQYPLDLGSTSGLTTTETIEIPSNYKVKTLPPKRHIDSGGITFDQEFTSEGKTVTLKQKFLLNKPRISPETYPAFQSALNRVKSAARYFVILEEDGQ